ncbi:MAG: HEAT repeat domain-containing protein [Planctomycetes bacterium]|nr:HEAT repeat domain-containing protein [Planctomycetota bacterium]
MPPLHTALTLPLLFAFAASGPAQSPPDVCVPTEAQQIARLQSHYQAVVEELSAADVSMLAAPARVERARLIGVLREFGERGEFGRNVDFPAARVPYFRTANGRRCAVAELMHASGEDAFVESVRANRNHVWISGLVGDATFESWLARSGLSIEDAGRIHGPPIIDPGSSSSAPSGPAGGSYQGPGDTVSGGGGAGSTPNSPRAGGGAAPSGSRPENSGPGVGARGPVNTGGGMPGVPRPMALVTTSDDTWWLWWEYNKNQYLRPNRLTLANAPMTGDDAELALRTAIAQARRSAVPLFERALSDSDANVRSTAAIALGRVGGGPAVEKLLKLLEDPNVDVRHKAILALGATATAEAVLPLLSIARHGSLDENSRSRISPVARPFAIVALGLGRRHDFDDRIDVEIAKIIQDRTRSDREPIGVAALMYQTLAPSKELARYALAMAKDDDESPSVRCRAVESLRTSNDDATLSEMQHFLSGSRLDLRRSAALALGEFQNSLALPALMTAFELEAEPLTRGFILISIGKQGGPKAQEYLTKVLEKGESGMRRWAALGLGIEARDMADFDVAGRLARTIREAQSREKNQDGMGAYWLASGLARDENARLSIRNALETASDARQRLYAASALALLGGEASLEVLRTRLKLEAQDMVRVGIADALGVMGAAQDAKAILDMLMNLNQSRLQGQAASAMAANGSADALMALTELARIETGSSVRRAAAIEGLGMILAPHAPLTFADGSRAANYTVFNDWIASVFQTTL